MHVLRVDGLRVAYGRVAAVHHVSLDVSEGEIVGLIGPNGAGKSTTLNTIAGGLTPVAGTVSFRGESIVGTSPENINRRGLAYVPERRHIFATLSVAENLLLGAIGHNGGGRANERIDRELERFPVLRRYYNSNAGRLSGGEQQQLAIARALVAQPRLLLLDEPSLGLAPLMVDLVFTVLDQLRCQGVSILLVEQNARRAIDLADRTYVMSRGRIVMEGARGELMRDQEMAAAYFGSLRRTPA